MSTAKNTTPESPTSLVPLPCLANAGLGKSHSRFAIALADCWGHRDRPRQSYSIPIGKVSSVIATVMSSLYGLTKNVDLPTTSRLHVI